MGTPSITSPRNSLLISYLNSTNNGSGGVNGPSTGALLTALNRAYKNGEAAIWLHNSSLVRFTRPDPEDGEEQGPGVRELANRVWEHARRRAEDQVVLVRYSSSMFTKVLIEVVLLDLGKAGQSKG
jgi:hypothetical protein